MPVRARRLLTRWFGFRGQLDAVGRGVRGEAGQGLDRCSGRLDLVAVLLQQRPGLEFCLGDGAGHDAERAGEHVLRQLEALAEHGDQDLFGAAERGRVAACGLAGGRAAVGDVEGGLALGLVGVLSAAVS